ncbi:MAG: RCC1 repeat- and reductase domain-containing protein [Bacteroidetes bacterium]|nr:RCC1 repeat- and reductase domain-containing protein [Bacteroidota bacterium]
MNKFISSFNFVILTLIISGIIFLKPQEGFAQRLSVDGQLGNGLNTNTNFPVTALIDSVIYLSSGGASANGYTLAVKSNGTVWAWGGNTYGNLGDGTYVSRNTPVQVPNLININSVVVPTVQVRAFSLALDNDGIIWAWGENNSGVLGNGTTNNRITPGQVPGLFNVKKITAGGSGNVIALCEDGSVWTWGENNLGQLGDGTTTTKLTPVQLFGLPPMIDIAAGFQHGLGLSVDSNVWAWGVNSAGEIGDDSLITRLNPIRLFSLSGISKVFAGFRTSFALKNDSSLWAWGVNNYGQLGIGTLDSSLHPVQVLTSDITDIGVGDIRFLLSIKTVDCGHGVTMLMDL